MTFSVREITDLTRRVAQAALAPRVSCGAALSCEPMTRTSTERRISVIRKRPPTSSYWQPRPAAATQLAVSTSNSMARGAKTPEGDDCDQYEEWP